MQRRDAFSCFPNKVEKHESNTKLSFGPTISKVEQPKKFDEISCKLKRNVIQGGF